MYTLLYIIICMYICIYVCMHGYIHTYSDLADLKQDPRYKEWKSKLSAEDGARFHALECDNANLQQEVNHQADLLFR